jgi:hypothetical protein
MGQFGTDVHLKRTGDADGSQDQRHRRDQIQESIEVFQRATEVLLALVHRVEVQPQVGQFRAMGGCPPLHRHLIGQLEHHPVAGQAGHAEQPRFRQSGGRQIGPGSQRRERHRVSGHSQERSEDAGLPAPDVHRIARLQAELVQHAGIENHPVTAPQGRERRRRIAFEFAIERKLPLQRPRIDQAGGVGRTGENRHGRKTGLAGRGQGGHRSGQRLGGR